MKLNTYVQQSSNLFARNRLLQFVVIVLAVCLVLTSFMAYRAVRYQKVILIPPQMTGTVEGFLKIKCSNQRQIDVLTC